MRGRSASPLTRVDEGMPARRRNPRRYLFGVLAAATFSLLAALPVHARTSSPGAVASAAATAASATAPITSTAAVKQTATASGTATSGTATSGTATFGTATSSSSASAAEAATSSDSSEPPGPTLSERAKQWWEGFKGLSKEWPSPLFEAHFWNTTMAGVRVVLPLIAAALLLGGWVTRRGHGQIPRTHRDRVARVFTVVGFLVYYGFFNPNIRHPDIFQPRAFYHDYLGTKYAAELAGMGLVDCTLAAEKELGKNQNHHQRYVYSQSDPESLVLAVHVASASDPTLCSERFTPERWTAFRDDVSWFQTSLSAEAWGLVQRTRPHASSPGFKWIVALVAKPAASKAHFVNLALLEPVLHAIALLAVGAGFGPLTAALVSIVWGCQPFFPFHGGMTLLGNLHWVAWLIGISAWRRQAAVVGSVAIAVGVCVAPLSGLALAPIAAAALGRRVHQSPILPKHALSVLAVTLGIGLALSTRVASHREYVSQLELRASLPELSDVGLSAVFGNHATARYRFQLNDALPDPASEWTLLRGKQQSETKLYRVLLVGLIGLVAVAVAYYRRSLVNAAMWGLLLPPLLSQPLAMCLGFGPLALLAARRPELALTVLTGVAGCNLLANRLTFPDDAAAAMSGVLWVTTGCVLLSTVSTALVQLSSKRPAARREELLTER
jgi:hypothetical protein